MASDNHLFVCGKSLLDFRYPVHQDPLDHLFLAGYPEGRIPGIRLCSKYIGFPETLDQRGGGELHDLVLPLGNDLNLGEHPRFEQRVAILHVDLHLHGSGSRIHHGTYLDNAAAEQFAWIGV
ncbi:hypothetical protein Holit_03406 [Hollandina sp. SP2]